MMRADRVQRKLLIRLLSHTSLGQTNSLSCNILLAHFKLTALARDRVQHDLIYLRNIMREKVDAKDLLGSLPLHVSHRSTRTPTLFTVPRARVRTIESEMFCRMSRQMNAFLAESVDANIFLDSSGDFRANYVLSVQSSLLFM